MRLSAVSVLVVAQSSSEIPDGLMNNPVYIYIYINIYIYIYIYMNDESNAVSNQRIYIFIQFLV